MAHLFILIACLLLFSPLSAAFADDGSAKRGEYLARAANCAGCHTADAPDAVPFAGGRAVRTPFGTFYGPNITQDKAQGIGSWKEQDFVRAMRYGIRPDGSPYFPAFPYLSYTQISDADLHDLWTYLRTIPANATPSRKHDLGLLFGWRYSVKPWQWMFFKPVLFTPDSARSAKINRGAYLVRALGHCGECHTPRNLIGVPNQDRFLAGGTGPEGKYVPNLSPANLAKWSDKELYDFLTSGIEPDGDIVGETMGIVIRNSTSKLTPADLDAMIAYLRSLPPIAGKPPKKK